MSNKECPTYGWASFYFVIGYSVFVIGYSTAFFRIMDMLKRANDTSLKPFRHFARATLVGAISFDKQNSSEEL